MNQLFQTQNLALADTLLTLGVPLPKLDTGEEYCVINYYDKDVLRGITDGRGNPRYKGMTVEQAAEEAWKDGKPGVVAYCFVKCELLDEILRAYDEQSKAAAAATEQGGNAEASKIEGEPAEMAKLAYQLLRNRRVLRDAWKDPLPVIGFHGAQTTRMEGSTRVITGSFKAMSLGASQRVRQKLKL